MPSETITPLKASNQLRTEFWEAPGKALLNRKTIAAGIGRSIGWMELKATSGGGIPFYKCGRQCLYRKSDAIEWLEQNSKKVLSTSEYKALNPVKEMQL